MSPDRFAFDDRLIDTRCVRCGNGPLVKYEVVGGVFDGRVILGCDGCRVLLALLDPEPAQ